MTLSRRRFRTPINSIDERRYLIIGMSALACILVVSHTETGDIVRIINARTATGYEQTFYEEDESSRS
jgi:uncharacterized protein